jgi:5-enolpyruvylshikimate-3-phosphate synthase
MTSTEYKSECSFICTPGGLASGSIRVPGDKSMSHRSIMLSSIAEGTSYISGFLQGEDSLNTLRSFQAMGVDIKHSEDKVIQVSIWVTLVPLCVCCSDYWQDNISIQH